MTKFAALLFSFLFSQFVVGQNFQLIPPVLSNTEVLPVQMLYGTIVNSTGNPEQVYLEGTVTSTTSDTIFEATSRSFTLPGGITTINSANANQLLSPVDVVKKDGQYESIVAQTALFPPGTYDFCVALHRADGGDELASTCIYSHTIFAPTPPMLISPFNGSELISDYPIFTYTPPQPMPMSGMVSYKVRVFELYAGQSAYAARRSNPAFFIDENIFGNLLQYPISAQPFTPCATYSWQVEAWLNGTTRLGVSEIWTFAVPCDEQSEEGTEDEVGRNIYNIYLQPTKRLDGGYYLVNDTLRFTLDYPYENTADLECQVYDANMEKTTSAPQVLNMASATPGLLHGDNRLAINLLNKGLEPDAFYLLKITNIKGQVRFLRFQFTGEVTATTTSPAPPTHPGTWTE